MLRGLLDAIAVTYSPINFMNAFLKASSCGQRKALILLLNSALILCDITFDTQDIHVMDSERMGVYVIVLLFILCCILTDQWSQCDVFHA